MRRDFRVRSYCIAAYCLTLVAAVPLHTAHASPFKVLYSYCSQTNCVDGAEPQGTPILKHNKDLIGITIHGGSAECSGCGVVYKITSHGQESVLYTFVGGSDGLDPFGDLTADANGNLYGTTTQGGGTGCGGLGCGTVFKVTPNGVETVLYSFCSQNNCADGRLPWSGVIVDASGNLYGTTALGGAAGYGTVFKLAPTGTETVLRSFYGGSDGASPVAGLVADAKGNLYGTTGDGGGSGGCSYGGCGTVFRLAPDGTETVLHSFGGGSDGASPGYGKLLIDKKGNLFGTTASGGGSGCAGVGCGTVFKVTPNGAETILYAFCSQANCTDGEVPWTGLTADEVGNLYGTTSLGGLSGSHGYGTVFKLARNGREKVLHTFDGTDGSGPYGGMVLDSKGRLRGTAALGGSGSWGVVFDVKK